MDFLGMFSSFPLSTLLIVVYVVTTTTSLFGLVANVLLIYSVLRQPSLRRSPTYMTLVSLATSDALCLLSLLLFEWFVYTVGINQPLCKFLMFTGQAALSSSTYHLVGFSILRYLILVKPLVSMKHLTAKITMIMCAVIWTIALTFSLPLTFQIRLLFFNTSFNSTVPICVFNPSSSTPWLVTSMITTGFVPIFIIPAFHVAKVCQLRNRPPLSNTECRTKQVSVRIIASISITFVVTCLPNLIYWSLFLNNSKPTPEVFSLGYAFTAFCFVNNSVDPLFYFFFSENARKSIPCCGKRSYSTEVRQ